MMTLEEQTNTLITALISKVARREINRSMVFSSESPPAIPLADKGQPRLLYLHIPFCERLCPYCSFNRVTFDETLARAYFVALRKEIILYRDMGYGFSGLYAGGGTPTILMDELEQTLDLARACFRIGQVSVETNPNHLTEKNITALKRAGVNRLSVGIQSFDDDLLKSMERYERYGSGREIARRMKEIRGRFDTLNADMIFNFSTQTAESLDRDLDVLMDMAVDQVTYYPLMVSDSTREHMEKTLGRADTRREETFYNRIVERLASDYRFSSAWCLSRKTAASHSIIDEYVVDYDDYAGLGSGSIGYLQGTCYANTFNIHEYINRVESGEIPLMAARNFSLRERVRYDFLMKLFGGRLHLPSLRKKYGTDIFRHLWQVMIAFRLAGGIRYWDDQIFLTKRGRYYWVIMMREFFTAVNNFRDYCRA
jgi:coproporphyrinogen III oxidase-like Fe-S oxidoreductase